MSDANDADRRVGEREYLFDMLAQLATIAGRCGEEMIARVLLALVGGPGSPPSGSGGQ